MSKGLGVRLLARYIEQNPWFPSRVGLQVSAPTEQASGGFLYWEHWPRAWQARVAEFIENLQERYLPIPDETPILSRDDADAQAVFSHMDGDTHVYRSKRAARDMFFAHIAHVVHLDSRNHLPWRVSDYSHDEQTYLLGSASMFAMWRIGDEEYYTTAYFRQPQASSVILGNPLATYAFLRKNPEGGNLIGKDQIETIGNLSAWMADYLYHNPGPEDFDSLAFRRDHPHLSRCFKRHEYMIHGKPVCQYVSPVGCWTASDFVADVLRAVNIPIRKVQSLLQKVDLSGKAAHSGVIYNWQGGGGRYLQHTDTLYTESLNFIPTMPGEGKGARMMDHIWLDPSAYGNVASYTTGSDGDIFSESTWDQIELYKRRARELLPHRETLPMVLGSKDAYVARVVGDGTLSMAEAEANYDRLDAMLRAHGDGDKTRGIERIDELFNEWSERTGKVM